jgi:hypothetical protein
MRADLVLAAERSRTAASLVAHARSGSTSHWSASRIAAVLSTASGRRSRITAKTRSRSVMSSSTMSSAVTSQPAASKARDEACAS